MKLRKILVFTGCLMILLATTSFKGKLKFATMYIQKDSLIKLAGKNITALYFNCDYDNRGIFSRDRVYLVSHSFTTSYENVALETVKKNQVKFHKDMKFSVYYLSLDTINYIIGQASNPKVFYFILEPIPYEDDDQYVSYEIILGDKDKKPLSDEDLKGEGTGMHHNIKNRFLRSTGSVSDKEILSPGGDRKVVVGRLDPSPPARPH